MARYLGRHGTAACAKAVLIGAVPPLMLKTAANPGGLPMRRSTRFARACWPIARSSSWISRCRSTASTGLARRCHKACAIRSGCRACWRAQERLDCIKAFSETDFTEDLKKIDVPTLIMHGDDDQIVPIGASPQLSSSWSKAPCSRSIQGCHTDVHVTDDHSVWRSPGVNGRCCLPDTEVSHNPPRPTETLVCLPVLPHSIWCLRRFPTTQFPPSPGFGVARYAAGKRGQIAGYNVQPEAGPRGQLFSCWASPSVASSLPSPPMISLLPGLLAIDPMKPLIAAMHAGRRRGLPRRAQLDAAGMSLTNGVAQGNWRARNQIQYEGRRSDHGRRLPIKWLLNRMKAEPCLVKRRPAFRIESPDCR